MTESHHSTPRLWSLHHDGRSHGVISASDEGQAWRIVRALQNLGDLPATPLAALCPSTADVVRRVRRAAKLAEVGEGFLACLDGGVFITQFCGGLP